MREEYIYLVLYYDIDSYTFNEKAIISKEDSSVIQYDYYRFNFYSFDDIYNHNNIYIMSSNEYMINSLVGRGFSCLEFGNYYVLFYEKK